MAPRWQLYTSVAVLVCEFAACFFAGSMEWGNRQVMVVINPAEAAEQKRFAVELYTMGAVIVLASTVLVIRRTDWTWWLVGGTQAALLVFALIEGMRIDPDDIGWVFFSSLPLVTMLLLFMIRNARAKPKPSIEHNLTLI